jgi:hypothetical protein
MIIPETLLKIKRPARILGEGLIMILILGLVFTLGRISTLSAKAQNDPLEVVYPPLVSTTVTPYNEAGSATAPETWASVSELKYTLFSGFTRSRDLQPFG